MNLKRVIEVIIKGDDKSGPAFKNLKDRVKGLVKNKAALAAAAAAAGVAIVAMASKAVAAYDRAIDKAGRFQKAVLEVTTLTGGTADETAELSKELQNLAVKYGQVDEVMAKAQYNAVSAGFDDIADSMIIMEVASKAAIGGVSNVNTAVKVITQTLNAYGKGAEDAEEVAGILFATIKGGVTTLDELAGTLGKVTGIAAQANIPFEQIASGMAVLTKNGANSAEAATQLSAFILAIGAASGESKDLLDEMSITLENGLGPALEAVSKASGGSIEKLAELIPNVRAIRAAASAASNDGEDFAMQLDAMASGAEDFNAAYDIMSKSYQQSADKNTAASARFENAIGSTGLEGKQAALDAWTESLDFLADVVEENSDSLIAFTKGLGELAGLLIKATAGAVGFVHWIGEKLTGALRSSGEEMDELNPKVKAFADRYAESAKNVERLQKALDSITKPELAELGLQLPTTELEEAVAKEQKILKDRTAQAAAEAAKQAEAMAAGIEASLIKEAETWGVDLFKTAFDPSTGLFTQIAKSSEEVAAEITAKLNQALTKEISASPILPKDMLAVEADPTGALTEEVMLLEDIIAAEVLLDEQQRIRGENEGARLLAEAESLRVIQEEIDVIVQKEADRAEAAEEAQKKAEDAADAVERIGDATVKAFLRGENTMKKFADVLKNEVINAIAKVIAELIRAQALALFFKIFTGGTGGGTPLEQGGTPLAAGGRPIKAAAGFEVTGGARGFDSVDAKLMPGENVVDRSTNQRLKSYLASRESAAMADPNTLATGGGGGATVVLQVARPVGYLDVLDLGDAAVTAGKMVAEANL